MRRPLVLVLLFALLAPLFTAAQDHEYRVGQQVIVTAPVRVLHDQPNPSSLGPRTVEKGDLLQIVDGAPVRVDDFDWWNVRVLDGGETGWLAEDAFTAVVDEENDCWTAGQTANTGLSWTEPPAMTIDRSSTYIATITTSEGTIMLELDAADAPLATNNFLCLADAGYYDGTIFHRISSDFLIQAGDRTGTGTGTPGYTIPSDPTTGSYPEGAIALANSKPDHNGSQFSITAADLTGKIPDDYPVFGQVIVGQEIVMEISRGAVDFNPRGEHSQPVDPVTIDSIEITRQDDELGPPLPTMPSISDATPTPAATPISVTTPPQKAAIGISLDAKDIAFDPTQITIKAADEPVTIKMENTGAALHNFTIDSLNISVDVQPGETVDVVIPAGTAAGTYDFYCDIPGHKEAGMVGTLIVR